MGFKLGRERRQIRNSKNTPIFRKKLEGGVMGKANNDGSIDIDKSVPPGSPLEKKIINHETQHMKDMNSGKLSYGDDFVQFNGVMYPRKNINGKDMIIVDGVAKEAGDDGFPWERDANNV